MANCSKNKQESVIIDDLRHAEYYDMQDTFDALYEKSKANIPFDNLMDIILSEQNILLAYRNIKQNAGSYTPGTDNLTIRNIAQLSSDEVVDTVRKRINAQQGYSPKAVRRKNIPKPNGSLRPLGIPCIWDRLIQQCIKQVLDPICEAKFNDHSYGFRIGRSTEQAIAEVHKWITLTHCYYIVEVDIKSFFDNVNHKKLIKQIWSLGIHDKHLIYVIKQILKAPIKMQDGSVVIPQTGTPQGGILSPLLANIVLNELDWWICNQWENNPIIDNYAPQYHKNGSPNNGHGYRAMRDTKLKEMYIVRYADDFRIACRSKEDADKIMIAVTKWLAERLKLEVSLEKTRVVNVKKQYTEFLGIKMKVRQKAGKLVTESHISDKKLAQITDSLKEQINKIRKSIDNKGTLEELLKYNSMVLGIHNYFCIATHVNIDCAKIAFEVNRTLENKLKSRGRGARIARSGRPLTAMEKTKYGKSQQLRYEKGTGCPIYPIGYVQTRKPMNRKYGQTPYSENGRALIHTNLSKVNIGLLHALMHMKVYDNSVEYADNRISLFSAQCGKCAITGTEFSNIKEIHCHHKIPKTLGGNDAYDNLVLILEPVHKLIHAKDEKVVQKYIEELNLSKAQLQKINQYREIAQVPLISV